MISSAKARCGISEILLSIALAMTVTTPAILSDEVHYLEPDRQPRFADSAEEITGEWVQRFSQVLSGSLSEKGDEEGGYVCYPDCPSRGVDEYDLWEIVHPGRIAEWRLTSVGILDGDSTTTIVEICLGHLWDMYCEETGIEGNQLGYISPESDGSSFIRISPKASSGDDDVHRGRVGRWLVPVKFVDGRYNAYGSVYGPGNSIRHSGVHSASEVRRAWRAQVRADPHFSGPAGPGRPAVRVAR